MTRRLPNEVPVLPEALERARNLAFDALIDGMHFHEVAIADPFQAERDLLKLCEGILDALGPPQHVTTETLHLDGCTLRGDHSGACDV